MKRFLIFCFCFIAINATAQSTSLSDSAFNAFDSGHYQEAIKLHKQLIEAEKKQRYHSAYAELLLSMCYVRLDSLEQAKDVLIRIFSSEKSTTASYDLGLAEDARADLADIYFKEKNYRKAIYYYVIHDGAWSAAHFNDINRFAVNYNRAISLSKCYEGLKLKDSAVVALMPYVFSSYRQLGYIWGNFNGPGNLKDSLKHDTVCRWYLTLLQKQHSDKSIKAELKKAEMGFKYEEHLRPSDHDSTFYWKQVTCDFTFFGIIVPYIDYTLGDKKEKLIAGTSGKQFTREYQLNYFLKQPLCTMIMNLPDKD